MTKLSRCTSYLTVIWMPVGYLLMINIFTRRSSIFSNPYSLSSKSMRIILTRQAILPSSGGTFIKRQMMRNDKQLGILCEEVRQKSYMVALFKPMKRRQIMLISLETLRRHRISFGKNSVLQQKLDGNQIHLDTLLPMPNS